MKSTRERSIIVYILSGLFLFGIFMFLYNTITSGKEWVSNSINEHVSREGMLSVAGYIVDRNGVYLARNVHGERVYSEDPQIRKALLHTIGDNTKFISTAVQNVYRADLIGYNFITGISTNKILGTGNNIRLTLDSQLCKSTLEDFGSNKGAALLYNYKTGEILCMVSSPTFDPENPPDISQDTTGQYDGVYLNKCLSSTFTPGSIFKIVTCATAIDNMGEEIYNRDFYCNGYKEVDNEKITCMERHGNIDFQEAMSQSCNIVFAELAMELGSDLMTKESEQMGFNNKLHIDGIALAESQYETKNINERDLGWSGIGQYTDLVNPVHMLVIMGAIANDGIAIEPYLIEQITTPIKVPTKVGYPKLMQRFLSKDTANKIKDIMRYTVKNNYGDDLFPEMSVCAKTGTAEVGNNKKPHGWIVGFSDDSDFPYAFAVVVENSGYGFYTAGPIAENLMKNAYEIITNHQNI